MSAGRQFGKYTLLERIGSGGMAEIWKASLKGVDGFEKILVVKKILPRYARNRQFITMFVQEAKVTSGLHHANVVQIYELGEENGEYFIAMEYVPGYDLLKVLTQAARSRKPLPPELCLYVVTEVCKGLGYAHGATDMHGKALNMVHLDVSPSNILLSWEGEVKLTDFGVARATTGETPGAKDDRLKGKLGYMSPEQVTGKTIDHRSDLFSLGIILYELFTLKRLFLGKTDYETLSNIRDADVDPRLRRHPEIPPPIAAIVRNMLTRNVETRFQSAFEVEEAISQYLFEQRMRVTPQHMARYLVELFGDRRPVHQEVLLDPSSVEVSQLGGTQSDSIQVTPVPDTVVSQPKRARERSKPASSLQESAFRFKSSESGIFGPITYDNLKNLLRTGSVAPDELVSINDTSWRPLREVTRLVDLAREQLPSEPRPADDHSPFGPRNAARLLARIATSKRAARLSITRGGHRKEIYFRRGKPVHIASNRKRELLGSVLVKEGLINQTQLTQAIQACKDSGVPLGGALVDLGFLKQGDLFRLLDVQFREKFIAVFEWEDADYRCWYGEEPPKGAVPFMLDPYPAITEGVRRYVGPTLLEHYFAEFGSKTIRLSANPPFDIVKLKFAPREHRVRVALENRPTTLPALLGSHGRTPDDRRTVLFVLFLLHQTEHIRIG